jgi:hypothetical protein
MNKLKVMVSLVLLVYIGFVIFQFRSNEFWANALDAILLPLISIAYFKENKRPNLYFSLFLICYSVSDLMIFIVDFIPYAYFYYVGNGLYIIAYTALFIKIIKSLSFQYIILNFKFHLVVLTALNIYIAYVLQDIVNPYVGMTNEYFVEIAYNVSMLLVLTASLLNYLYRDDKKSLLIFLGSLSIVFSEVLGVAYMYVDQQNLLNFLVTTLTLLAFYFYFTQSNLKNEEVKQLAS